MDRIIDEIVKVSVKDAVASDKSAPSVAAAKDNKDSDGSAQS